MTKRKDGRWQKVIYVDGKRVYLYSSEATQIKAERDFTKQEMEYKYHQLHHPFKAVADAWIFEHEKKCGIATLVNSTLGPFNRVVDFFGAMEIEEIEAPDVYRFVESLIAMGYAKATIANHKSILNQIMRFAMMQRILKYNPCTGVVLPTGLPQTTRDLPSDDDIHKISQHWEGFDLFGYMSIYTGLRPSEMLALRWEDIKDGRILVTKVARRVGNRFEIVHRTKTKAGERSVPVIAELKKVLPTDKTGPIFDMCYSKKSFITQWNHYVKRYDIHCTPYQLRHAYATMLYEAGVDMKIAQRLMGHADPTTTQNIYMHIRQTHFDDVTAELYNFKW